MTDNFNMKLRFLVLGTMLGAVLSVLVMATLRTFSYKPEFSQNSLDHEIGTMISLIKSEKLEQFIIEYVHPNQLAAKIKQDHKYLEDIVLEAKQGKELEKLINTLESVRKGTPRIDPDKHIFIYTEIDREAGQRHSDAAPVSQDTTPRSGIREIRFEFYMGRWYLGGS